MNATICKEEVSFLEEYCKYTIRYIGQNMFWVKKGHREVYLSDIEIMKLKNTEETKRLKKIKKKSKGLTIQKKGGTLKK